MDRKEYSIFPLGEHFSWAELTWFEWGRTINQHCKKWIRIRLLGILHNGLYLYDFNHGVNETIRLRISWVECCTSNLFRRANCLNCLDTNWVAWSVYTVAGSPYSANIVLRRLITCPTVWLVSFFTTGNLLKVVGDQQVAIEVRKMLKYVNSKFEPLQATVLVASFVEQACIPFIRHIIWLHFSHPWARPKDCL